MEENRKFRLQLLAQNWFFVIVFIMLVVLLGYLSSEYRVAKDITQANRNILTKGSVDVLDQMEGPVNITVYATSDNASSGDNFRKSMMHFVARYQREKKDVNLNFVNPSKEPRLAQEAGVKSDGEVVVEFNKRSEHILPPITEQDMTNLFVRLSRTNTKPIMYLDGHGERVLIGQRNHDLGEFGKQLEAKGFKFANPDLTIAQQVPRNGAMLVIASPQVDVSTVELKKIIDYVNHGGNLLWLLDDENYRGLKPLADFLGISTSKGVVVDKLAAQYGADSRVAFASVYGEHEITKNFMLRTLFPQAHEVRAKGTYENGWEVKDLVEVAPNGWLSEQAREKGSDIQFNPQNDKLGPINIGVAMQRTFEKKGQRVVVMGNANFLSNTFITNGGNLDFGINIVNWLVGDDSLITIQPMPLKDMNVNIPENSFAAWVVFHAFQFIFPLLMMVTGFYLWWKRKKA